MYLFFNAFVKCHSFSYGFLFCGDNAAIKKFSSWFDGNEKGGVNLQLIRSEMVGNKGDCGFLERDE